MRRPPGTVWCRMMIFFRLGTWRVLALWPWATGFSATVCWNCSTKRACTPGACPHEATSAATATAAITLVTTVKVCLRAGKGYRFESRLVEDKGRVVTTEAEAFDVESGERVASGSAKCVRLRT